MVGLGLVKCWVWMVFATGVRPVSSVWFFSIGVRPVSFVWSDYRGETYKPVAMGYSWVTEVQCRA
jgi:hypothetical protein